MLCFLVSGPSDAGAWVCVCILLGIHGPTPTCYLQLSTATTYFRKNCAYVRLYYENPQHAVFTLQKGYNESYCFHAHLPTRNRVHKADTIMSTSIMVPGTWQTLKKKFAE